MSRKVGLSTPHFKRSNNKNNANTYTPPKDEHFLPVGRKFEDMINFATDAILKMPRSQRPITGKTIEGFMWTALRMTTEAGRYQEDKDKLLRGAIINIDMLRSAVRVAFNKGIISPSIYKNWVTLNNNIGRDLGAWHQKESNRLK